MPRIVGDGPATKLTPMKSRVFTPEKLDVQAFIEASAHLEGDSPVGGFARLASGLSPESDPQQMPAVRWSASGRLVPQRVGGAQLWLDLQAHAELDWECQRCLHSVRLPLSIDREIRFARDEAEAAKLDAESDEDVLSLSRSFNLLELLEDELIMAQPIVPRHETCPTDVEALMQDETETPVPGAPAEPQEADPTEKPHPFAALAALKKGGGA